MRPQLTIVESLPELIASVTPEEPEPDSGRRRNYAVYRGMSDVGAPLLTNLDRLGAPDAPHSKVHLEEHILRNFLRYSKPYVRADQAEWVRQGRALLRGAPPFYLSTR